MSHRTTHITRTILILFAIITFVACEKGSNELSTKVSLAGYAQKGQFIKGSTITAYALNNNLSATGESFPGMIADDLGSFSISSEVLAPYLELRAEGYYFNENTGSISEAPIYLNALVSSSQKEVNINLLTTLTSGRIKKLINEGKSFEVAKTQAEREALTTLSIQPNIEIGFEEMNITEDGEAHAILLAASCLIQEGRNAGEIQQLISNISAEFETSGTLSDRLINEIFKESQQVSIFSVVRNLIQFYNEKGITDFKIPPFYTILDKNYAQGFYIISPISEILNGAYNTEVAGGIKQYYAISCEEFIIESDVDWITADIVEFCSHLHILTINIASNPYDTGRTGHLYVKSKSGETLYTDIIKQQGNGQRIYFEPIGNKTTRSTTAISEFEEGDKMNINGKNYPLNYDPDLNMYYVDLPKSGNGYGISNMPEMVVAAANGDVLCATFTYQPEVAEIIHENTDIPIAPRSFTIAQANSYSATVEDAQSKKVPYYTALKGIHENELQNPAVARLETACSLLSLRFNYKGSNATPQFDKLTIELGAEGFLAGEVTTCMYPNQVEFYPNYTIPETVYKGKSNRVTVLNTNGDNQAAFLIHPQHIDYLKCTGYNANGETLFTVEAPLNYELRKGTNTTLSFELTE